MLKALTLTGCLLALAGCAATPHVPVTALPEQILWRDQAFAWEPARVPVSREELFALDPGLLETIKSSGVKEASTQRRIEYLLTLLFGPELKSFPYVGDQSRIAAETWRTRSGNCLSLSVLAYSMARALDLSVQLQEVRVPQYFNRRGNVDFVERHVNVLIRSEARLQLNSGTMTAGNVVIDFEPQAGWQRPGLALSEASVLARYYNNIAADYFAKDNLVLAYAWFKAAIQTDPAYSSSFGNLAQLYKRRSFDDSAEQLLLHAIALNNDDDTPVQSMYQLLLAQGRDAEAARYAGLLRARQEKNPYYWLGVGTERLRDANYAQAVYAFERAEALTTGFEEVHRYLAIAYWRNGNQASAKKQLALLASLLPSDTPRFSDPAYAALSRKISNSPVNYGEIR